MHHIRDCREWTEEDFEEFSMELFGKILAVLFVGSLVLLYFFTGGDILPVLENQLETITSNIEKVLSLYL